MFDELASCFSSISNDPDVRVVLVSAQGTSHFSGGLDLSEAQSLLQPPTAEIANDPARRSLHLRQLVKTLQHCFSQMESLAQPVISCIHGACIGAGVDLVCATDIRMCSEDAYFSIKEVDIGICADLGTLQRMQFVMGGRDSLARELAFTCRKFPAAQAFEAGFVSRVSPTKEHMMIQAFELAEEIAAKSPYAVSSTKWQMNHARGRPVHEALDHQALWSASMLQNSDVGIALEAAKSKTKPSFSNLR